VGAYGFGIRYLVIDESGFKVIVGRDKMQGQRLRGVLAGGTEVASRLIEMSLEGGRTDGIVLAQRPRGESREPTDVVAVERSLKGFEHGRKKETRVGKFYKVCCGCAKESKIVDGCGGCWGVRLQIGCGVSGAQ